MSRLFILFLIALLPLRGWSAERMVVPATPMPAECALHMQMAQQAADSAHIGHHQADEKGAQHKGCQNCQLCMPLASLDCRSVLPEVMPSQTALPTPASSFASADTARHAKPPIS
jgi:hypothetical protein